jgi:Protein kinase domain
LHPTGKPYPDEPSGDIAVQSDSALSSPSVSPPEHGSHSDLTVALTPGRPAEPTTKSDVPATPATFGRYQVRRTLGAGGFGAVYVGYDPQLDRPVAIKVLRGGSEVPQAKAEQFLQEARRLAQLSHPGIVAVHDVGLEGGQVYIVSEFLDGPDLGLWLGGNHPT